MYDIYSDIKIIIFIYDLIQYEYGPSQDIFCIFHFIRKFLIMTSSYVLPSYSFLSIETDWMRRFLHSKERGYSELLSPRQNYDRTPDSCIR